MRFNALLVALFICCIGYAYSAEQKDLLLQPSISIDQKELSGSSDKLSKRRYIALIIDDMGYRYQSGRRAINLPADITYSFLPYAPHARKLANLANDKQKEIMLHIPMEANNGKALGPGGLTSTMPKDIFDLELQHSLSAIPFIKGVNNHMGSLLTQQTDKMVWLMKSLSSKGIYFVDSRTSVKSQALKTAREFGIRSEMRDIFVDHDLSEDVMQQQLRAAMAVAKRRGSAVVIAHPFPETMNVLEGWLPKAKQQGYEFVYISKLLNIREEYRAQRNNKNKLSQERLTQWQMKTLKTKIQKN